MKKLPVFLGIARKGNASPFKDMPADAAAAAKQKIFDRDNNTCQCCGFESGKYQEVKVVDETARARDLVEVDGLADRNIDTAPNRFSRFS